MKHGRPGLERRVLLLASTRSYQVEDFMAAAERAGVDLVLGTDRCHMLAEVWPEGALALDFRDLDDAVRAICESAKERPIHGVLATDERTAILAERARACLGLGPTPSTTPGTTPAPTPSPMVHRGASIAGNKLAFRRALTAAGLAQPRFTTVARHASLDHARGAMDAAGLAYPVVIKPLHLSASRGVMRADDDRELARGLARVSALLDDPEVQARDPEAAETLLIEGYVPGPEFAFEGLLDARHPLTTLEIFDKPDPLEGPFFAETIYVAPTSQSPAAVRAMERAVARAVRAIGLCDGPVHAELRVPEQGEPVVIELAARAIGGLCQRTLRFAGGVPLEELLLRHAVGEDIRAVLEGPGDPAGGPTDRPGQPADRAHGVFMIPAPEAGVLRAVIGVDEARAIPGIDDITMTARIGDNLVPLPEGSAYMGFIFARGEERHAVLEALRAARARIIFRIAPLL